MPPFRASILAATFTAALALLLFGYTAAPGLTWANHGADGGELLVAALTNGVPHPPGYPLYMILLRGWLAFTQPVLGGDLAWRGNLLSALCAALSVGVTVLAATPILSRFMFGWLWAMVCGLLWAVSPLLWGQAVITEVYGLHALLLASLAWFALQGADRVRVWWLLPLTMLGVAHHLTFVLLLPAVVYLRWSQTQENRMAVLGRIVLALLVGGILGATFHLRTLWAAGSGSPVNWGYPDNSAGLWWLVSGQAYRGYLFSASGSITFDRVAAWAYTITTQFTPLGLALGLVGLSYFDRERPLLRNVSLLWLVPVSIYAIVYYTRDSEIYLLPVIWLLALWITVGLASSIEWLATTIKRTTIRTAQTMLVITGVAIFGLLLWRFPTQSLRQEMGARQFLKDVSAYLEPGSIVISRADERTFALWYGVWGSKELSPDLIVVNDALYQFSWYQRLQRQQHPDIASVDQNANTLITQNQGQRAIFFAEQIDIVPASSLRPVGPIWRYQ